MDARREKTPLEWEVDELRAENGRLRTFLEQNRMVDTRQWKALEILENDRDRLRASGDALAAAARGGLADIRDRSPVRPPLVAALTAWAAARGEGDPPRADAGAGPAPAPSVPPPDEPAIRAAVRAFVLAEFLPGEDPAELTDDTPLVTGGIVDPFYGVGRLAAFLRERYGVTCVRSDRDDGALDSVARIARLVAVRLAAPESEATP